MSKKNQVLQLLNGGGYESLGQAAFSTAEGLAQVQSAALAQLASIKAEKPASSTSGKSSGMDSAKSLAESMFGGLTLSPILSGLLSLFGGGGSASAPAGLPKYVAPYKISMEGGLADGASGVAAADYGQNGLPRAISSSSSQAQVTVNVQAMDSQSILDRSDDIARAVKRALLESSSLNDVVAEV